MTTVTLQLDISLVRQLKLIAKQKNITLSELVNMALREKLKELQNDGQI